MGDEVEAAQRRQAVEVVRMAIMAAGDVDDQWTDRVLGLTPRIAGLLMSSPNYPGAIEAATWVLQSDAVFRAKFHSAEREEKSQRVLVYVVADNAEEGAEPEVLRTEPMWSPLGKVMARRVKELLPGDELLIYKYVDTFQGDNGKGGTMTKKSRVLANFEVLRRVQRPVEQPQERPTVEEPVAVRSEPQPAPPVEPDVGAEDSAPPPASTSPLDDTLGADPGGPLKPGGEEPETAEARRMSAVDEAMKGLTNRQKVAVNAMCRGEGIPHWAQPSEDEIDKVLIIIKKIARAEESPQ